MQESYVQKEELVSDIQAEAPRLIFLTGKTSTGKTTLSSQLITHGYQLIELDTVVMESVVQKFKAKETEAFSGVYRGTAPKEWVDSFVEATRQLIISKYSQGPVLVEGALANNEIVQRIFAGELNDFVFIFLLPTNVEAYAARIKSRFENGIASESTGLPPDFFKIVGADQVTNYLVTKNVDSELQKGIDEFATWSAQESQRRLDYFRQVTESISVLQV